MSDAYYYKGLTIELDASVPRLTIEGRRVAEERLTALLDLAEPEHVSEAKIRQFGKDEIERSPFLARREAARQDHLSILAGGVPEWNRWRASNSEIRPLLYDSELTRQAIGTGLDGADLANAVLINSDLSNQELRRVNFHEANLGRANLCRADLTGANFCRADLYETNLQEAILDQANLQGAQLAKTNLAGAQVVGCTVYGMAAWDLNVAGTRQQGLVIKYRRPDVSPNGHSSEDRIVVDDLEVAHLVYLFLNNRNIPNVIDTMASKSVLILGRFTPERKPVLDAIRDELRRRGLVAIIFDFEQPESRGMAETVMTLANLARFVIADLTDAKSVLQELQAIVPTRPSLPVKLIVLAAEPYPSMLESLLQYPWVLRPPFRYTDPGHLLRSLAREIIAPADAKMMEIAELRREALKDLQS